MLIAAPNTQFEEEQNESQWTCQMLLIWVGSIFDPLGLGAPVLLMGKILLQETWKEANEWDSTLTPHLSEKIGE